SKSSTLRMTSIWPSGRVTTCVCDGGEDTSVSTNYLATRYLLGFVQILAADGVVAEADGVELLEPVADVVFGGGVVIGGEVDGFEGFFTVAAVHEQADDLRIGQE